MSKMFYDDLSKNSEEVEEKIKNISPDENVAKDLNDCVDELINFKAFEKVLDELPKESHTEFLELVVKSPHDETQIFAYIKEKTGKDIQSELGEKLDKVFDDLTNELKPHDEVSKETISESKPPVK